MIKFIKEPDPDNKFDSTRVEHLTSAISLSDILEAFEYFLKGSGFHFEGSIVIEEEDNETK